MNAVTAFGFYVSANSRAVAKINCGGTAEADDETPVLSQCEISISTASSDSIAGVRCFEPGKFFSIITNGAPEVYDGLFRKLSRRGYTTQRY